MLAVTGCPYSLRTTLTDILKTIAIRQTFITENDIKFICSVVTVEHDCNASCKSSSMKSFLPLYVS